MLNPSGEKVIYSEPWIDFSLNSLTGKGSWTKEDEIIWNQIQRQSSKYTFFIQAFDFIGDNGIQGDYHEFGCHRCRTFRMAMLEAKRHFMDEMNFYAYDSFEGLPQVPTDSEYDSRWLKGTLTTSEDQFRELISSSGFDQTKVITKKGFYDQTLTFETFSKHKPKSASIVTIDCDLYESAVPIFNVLDHILQEGSILYLDDYFTGYKGNPTKGVSKAFTDWLSVSDWNAEPYRDVGWAGKSFVIY